MIVMVWCHLSHEKFSVDSVIACCQPVVRLTTAADIEHYPFPPFLLCHRPQIFGACDVGVGVGYDFIPFRLLNTREGPVNLCASAGIDITEKSFCPRGASVVPNFVNAVASSYFKMSKLYVDAAGVMAGEAFGVARQPCQVGGPLVWLCSRLILDFQVDLQKDNVCTIKLQYKQARSTAAVAVTVPYRVRSVRSDTHHAHRRC